jgi:hypothetical protein
MNNYWIGCIEDRQDPSQIGRFRVRVLGLHTPDKIKLPTKDLPWCSVITPDGGNSGMGTSPPFFVEGTWVLVSFRDKDRQEPMIHGSISGKPSYEGPKEAEEAEGFLDPLGEYPLKKDEPDMHETARGVLTAANPVARDALRKTGISTADFDGFSIASHAGDEASSTISASDGSSWDIPLVVSGTYAPAYPFNHTFATESGHLLEFDDTSGHERVHVSHMSGSYLEWSADGTRTALTVLDSYDAALGSTFTYVGGNTVETVDGSLKLKVNNTNSSGANYDIEVGSGASLNIMVRDGNLNMNVAGNVNQIIDGDLNASMNNLRLDASGAATITAGNTLTLTGGDVDINGDPINLN